MNIWLDVTTTLSWGRPALGIVRVEAEIARYFLASGTPKVRFCRFDLEATSYCEITCEEITDALALIDAGGNPPTQLSQVEISQSQADILNNGRLPLLCTLPPEPIYPFETGDVYISLGIDWDQKDLVFLYELKQQLGLKVLLFCYDIIPILLPQHCVPGVSKKFPGYFVDSAWCADKILCISDCSRRDLEKYLKTVGAPIPNLEVVRLGSNILANADAPPSAVIREVLDRRYILFVSTIESRKNHFILVRAYINLLDKGHKDLPLLVFVGMQGWGVDRLMSILSENKRVKAYVQIFNHVSDSDLIHLYRNSLFTTYPSLYEGWGLPVAESLAYGKFCLASSAASIPEVGGNLIEHVDPLDESAWAARLLWYFQNPDAVTAREAEIVQRYNPSTWLLTGAAILNAAERLTDA